MDEALVNRAGQVWYSDHTLYVVLSSDYHYYNEVIEHRILVLDSDTPMVYSGETAREFENATWPWEENPQRRRVA